MTNFTIRFMQTQIVLNIPPIQLFIDWSY